MIRNVTDFACTSPAWFCTTPMRDLLPGWVWAGIVVACLGALAVAVWRVLR